MSAAQVLNQSSLQIIPNATAAELVNAVFQGAALHAVADNHEDKENEVATATLLDTNPLDFLRKCPRILLDPKQIMSEAIELEEYWIQSTKQKVRLVKKVREFVESIPKASSVVDSALMVADELITNALFNAPVDEDKHHVYNDLDRTHQVNLAEKDMARLYLATNGSRLVVGCRDPFGSLRPQALVQHIKKTFDEGISSAMNMGGGGAHIGLRMVLDVSMSLYIVVDPWNTTNVFAVLPIGRRYRQMDDVPKALHVVNLTK
ncbi:MAG: hypothetical protein COT74_01570 [Bdellovibrionales bacterium CG10_big_fil_rev_8_21_14_0_10_45_34]|nr:MAG: hypothetical protein COT74_01570 [Bdellovibrionales bacterium CG10_big_fil_rev_8_21_14_0_10_45_34]